MARGVTSEAAAAMWSRNIHVIAVEHLRRSNPSFLYAAKWIASRSLSSGEHSRDPVARNDG
jgi:hypothetical protein